MSLVVDAECPKCGWPEVRVLYEVETATRLVGTGRRQKYLRPKCAVNASCTAAQCDWVGPVPQEAL
jgi:hypothetical protein